jgi:hypothetical protein
MCQLAQISRAGFYRYLECRVPEEEDMTVRSAIQEIALEHERYYGYRRVTAELRRCGMMVSFQSATTLGVATKAKRSSRATSAAFTTSTSLVGCPFGSSTPSA